MTEKSTDNQNPTVAPRAFRIFLRVYGVLTLAIFISLFIGFLAQSPLLAEHGGVLNWTIWNDVRCGGEHMHVPPMLMVIYIVWGRVPTAVGQKSPRLPVVSQLHHVGQPRPRRLDGGAGRHRTGPVLEQIPHRHPVRPDPGRGNLPLATH